MRNPAAAALLGLAVSTTAPLALAEGWSFPALTGDNYRAEPTLALIGGQLDPDVTGADADDLWGLELSLNCPLIQPPSNRIRQQASLTRYDDQGLKITSLEINPHYVVPVSEHMELGFGPGVGIMKVDSNGNDETLLGLQAGVSLHYRRDAFFFGAEARYQITDKEDFGAGKVDVDNSRVLLKVGINL
ncbi:hypothetical protein [Motiliproteus sediminis]|uniref:hypothetical protein n=1 Tax=Motiliproteus sediminis TaxID=1468178 RepID=UPI001AEF460E|nr:hypothetical protein [Motiliproteus sediminis]